MRNLGVSCLWNPKMPGVPFRFPLKPTKGGFPPKQKQIYWPRPQAHRGLRPADQELGFELKGLNA